MRNGRKEFLLKLKNYPDSENTCEPSANVECPELINDFKDKLKKKNEDQKKTAEKDRGSPKKKLAEEEPSKPRGFN